MRIMPSGRARISARRPRALGESDRSGMWYSLDDMVRQFQYAGNGLIDTGLLVGRDEVDKPQAQFLAPILPADPLPRFNPRPSPNVTGIPNVGNPLPGSPENLGFTQYILGASNSPLYPMTQAGVLAQVASNSGVPTPSPLGFYAPIMQAFAATLLVPANPVRSFLLVYNPTQAQAQISTGTAARGMLGQIAIGPGEAYFWATAQGLGQAYQGALTGIAMFGGLPLWVWEDGGGFVNDAGFLTVPSVPPGYPTDPAGLLPGAIWSNGLFVVVVPGISPDPLAPPVYFGTPPDVLLALGGGNLPLLPPLAGSLQIWNNGGFLCVA